MIDGCIRDSAKARELGIGLWVRGVTPNFHAQTNIFPFAVNMPIACSNTFIMPGDIIVAAENFGCGSSREHAPVAIKGAGVSCVIAATFARIFFRNALNIGLPIVESAEAAQRIEAGDTVEIDANSGRIVNHTKGETYQAAPFPPFVQELVAVGGLVPYVARRLQERAHQTAEGA